MPVRRANINPGPVLISALHRLRSCPSNPANHAATRHALTRISVGEKQRVLRSTFRINLGNGSIATPSLVEVAIGAEWTMNPLSVVISERGAW